MTRRPGRGSREMARLVPAALILALVFAVFWQVRSHRFLNYDDDVNLTKNAVVRGGLTWEGVAGAFTDTRSGHWQPFTDLSHMVVVTLFGLDPAAHHLVNVLIHGLNAVLLFLLLGRATGAPWRSAFVAALFAVHPLRVESVAWVTERRDVLCAFFWLLATGAWLRYVDRPSRSRYAAVVLPFAAGLLSKAMLVTLPVTLLLLDYWPLGRFASARPARLLREKLPLFLLSAASAVATYAAAGGRGALVSTAKLPVTARLANAAVSAGTHLWKTVWPHPLAAFYPFPDQGPELWKVAGAVLFVAAATILAVREGRRRPYLLFGWVWFLATLVPVSGIVQAGMQAMADRHTYMPLVGPFVAVAWGAHELAGRLRLRRAVVAELAAGTLCILALVSWFQVKYWRDDVALFRHAVETVPRNYLAEMNLGVALEAEDRSAEAIGHYREALRFRPEYPEALFNLGVALGKTGQKDEAASCYRALIRLRPRSPLPYVNLGVILEAQGLTGDAEIQYREALRLRPDFALAHNNLGSLLGKQGRLAEAEGHFREALRLDPGNALAKSNLQLISRMREAAGAPRGRR